LIDTETPGQSAEARAMVDVQIGSRDQERHHAAIEVRTTAATANIPVIVLSGRQLNDVTVQSLTREICGHQGIPGYLRTVRNSEKKSAASNGNCQGQSIWPECLSENQMNHL
jgi:hypothetical protein